MSDEHKPKQLSEEEYLAERAQHGTCRALTFATDPLDQQEQAALHARAHNWLCTTAHNMKTFCSMVEPLRASNARVSATDPSEYEVSVRVRFRDGMERDGMQRIASLLAENLAQMPAAFLRALEIATTIERMMASCLVSVSGNIIQHGGLAISHAAAMVGLSPSLFATVLAAVYDELDAAAAKAPGAKVHHLSADSRDELLEQLKQARHDTLGRESDDQEE